MEQSNNSFATGMLVNMALIVGGVGALMWLSTQGHAEAEKAMEGAGNFIMVCAMLVPFFWGLSAIASNGRDGLSSRRSTFVIIAVIAVQMALFYILPPIVERGNKATVELVQLFNAAGSNFSK